MVERDLFYEKILPVMKSSGLEDTPKNRHAFLIGVRTAMQNSRESLEINQLIAVITDEIIRLSDEISID